MARVGQLFAVALANATLAERIQGAATQAAGDIEQRFASTAEFPRLGQLSFLRGITVGLLNLVSALSIVFAQRSKRQY